MESIVVPNEAVEITPPTQKEISDGEPESNSDKDQHCVQCGYKLNLTVGGCGAGFIRQTARA